MKHERTPQQHWHMSSNARRLQFAVRFATMDLNALRPGDWLNLRDDVMMFVGVGAGPFRVTREAELTGSITDPPWPDNYPPATFHMLQAEAKRVFNTFLNERMGEVTFPHAPKTKLQNIELVTRSAGPHAPQPGCTVTWVGGNVRDVFLYVLHDLLTHERTNMILRCPECGNPFYRIKKQAYCSRACANRVNQRRWRERQDASAPASA